MSERIRVRVVAEFEIDPEAYVAAGIEAEWFETGDLDPADYGSVAQWATGYLAADDKLPRWARDAMRVTNESVEVLR